ncbi:uncharacterized protein [Cherax quadricarinatus]|uniref:uncharacterized protein n=1 Tax=Cherax quadricarinatus TaxID=27406 RepID=UPI002379A4E6|nr:uncharacterized protein LOC128690381 [Cherax quadricarinatus]
MMQRLMMFRNKSGKCMCTGLPGSPPCYDCTFSLKNPPPNYASISENVKGSISGHSPASKRRGTPPASRKVCPSTSKCLEDPASSNCIQEDLLEATDFEVARLSHAMGRIGLAVAFLADGQDATVAMPSDVNTKDSARCSSLPSFVEATADHPRLPHPSSAPELDLFSSQTSRCPAGRRLPGKDYHLVLPAIINHLYRDPTLTSETALPPEASPLPCQLLVPE